LVHTQESAVVKVWMNINLYDKCVSPEESSFRQQSENPLSAARCSGNMPWMPRLQGAESQSH